MSRSERPRAIQTYERELSASIARSLAERDLPGTDPVPLVLSAGAPLFAAMLGVLKAGGFYVPLDPAAGRVWVRSVFDRLGAGGGNATINCAPGCTNNPAPAGDDDDVVDGLLDLTEDVASTKRVMELSEGAKTAFIPQCGLAPGFISILEASHFDADTAYAAVDRHRLDDIAPHIYRTRDGGKTWHPISTGISPGSYVNVINEAGAPAAAPAARPSSPASP